MKRTNLFLLLCSLAICTSTFAQVSSQALDVSTQLYADGSPQVNALFDGLLGGDFALAGDQLSEQFQIFGTGPEPKGKGAYLEMWQGYHAENGQMNAALTTHPITVNSGEMQGDWVMVWGEAKWTPKGGNEITSWFHQMLKVDQGQVVMGYHFQDELAILMQMGFQVSPPAMGQGE